MATSTTYSGYTAEAADQMLVMKFERNVGALVELLSNSDVHVLAPGTSLKTYTNTCTLQDGSADPGASITATTYSTVAATKELTFKKWLKNTPIEAIAQQGWEGAVLATDNQLLRDVQKAVRKSIITGIATGSGSATGATFQAACANGWAAVEEAFEDEGSTPVFFCNASTAAGYLGTATITVQESFGLKYVENFLGLGTLIIDSNVADDYIYCTAKENIIIAAADLSGVEGIPLTMDESGIIAVQHVPSYGNASAQTVVYTGLCVFPMFASRVIKSVVDPS